MVNKEQKDLAETIAKANGGCVAFNITRAAKIAGRSRYDFPEWLNRKGVLVEKTGRGKLISVNDLAIAMLSDRVSPLV